jgi:anthranilate phosphoribosyltransferase
MSIASYIKLIGRQNPVSIDRAQACDLMGQILDGHVSDYEIGAFCMAMRIKGETDQELAGFIDATHARLTKLSAPQATPIVVLPCYNGARKLPVLTPLLSSLLAQQGICVVLHGSPTEASRVTTQEVLRAMGHAPLQSPRALQAGEQVFIPTQLLHPKLDELLQVRRKMGLRNAGHSLVKLINPTDSHALVVASYTHPYYVDTMLNAWALTQGFGFLLRGTEGEVVADPRRCPQMQSMVDGQAHTLVEAQTGSLTTLPELPASIDAFSTASYIHSVLQGDVPIPAPIALQVNAIIQAINLNFTR